jgi:hypothetical protein
MGTTQKLRGARRTVEATRASDWHFSDSPEADISSMRQLVTEAPEAPTRDIDSLHIVCKSERQITYQPSNNRAYYWQSLLIRQAQRDDILFHPKVKPPKQALTFLFAPFLRRTGDRIGYR